MRVSTVCSCAGISVGFITMSSLMSITAISLHDVVRLPLLVVKHLRGAVEADAAEPSASGDGLDPVGASILRHGRAKVNVRRAIGVELEVAVGGDGGERLAVVQ